MVYRVVLEFDDERIVDPVKTKQFRTNLNGALRGNSRRRNFLALVQAASTGDNSIRFMDEVAR